MAGKLSDGLSRIEEHIKKYRAADTNKPVTKNQKPLDRFTNVDELLLALVEEQRITTDLLQQILEKKPENPEKQQLYVPQDNSLSLIAGRLDRLIELQAVRGRGEKGQDIYFTYPADGTKKTVGAGRTIIDFYNGVVKLPDGTEEKISDSLVKHKLEPGSIRSFTISADQAAKYSLDYGGLKPITATDFQSDRNESFSTLILETTVDTPITIWASTNPDAFFGKIGAGTTGGLVNIYGVQIDPVSEYGTPKGDIGYYSGASTNYTTLKLLTVSTGKYGVLHEVSMTPHPKALFRLTIGGVTQFTDIKLINPVTLKFPPCKLAAATQILIEVKSSDGTSIEVNGEVSLKEVVIS